MDIQTSLQQSQFQNQLKKRNLQKKKKVAPQSHEMRTLLQGSRMATVPVSNPLDEVKEQNSKSTHELKTLLQGSRIAASLGNEVDSI